ncbi:MAG: DUF1592 domain-containing protein [Lentisphaerales bacterium]|nr:DUF1592 domain-containing protein [Lentisphaerales bacterium]
MVKPFIIFIIICTIGCGSILTITDQQSASSKKSQIETAEAAENQNSGKESTKGHVVSEAHLTKMGAFMDSYCYSCHNEQKKKGKLRLDDLQFNAENLLVWQEIADRITTEDMPPEDEKMPTQKERQDMVLAILENIENIGKGATQSPLRRLTQKEYVNTVRDLFSMRTEVFMGASEFPPDERKHNFSNNGEALVTSSYLMDKYLDAANAIVDQVLPEETTKPKTQKWSFKPPFRLSKQDFVSWYYGRRDFQDMMQNETSLREIYLYVDKFSQGVPERGLYKIRVQVEGMNRNKRPSPLGNKLESLSIKVAAGILADGDLGRAVKSDKFIGEYPLPDDEKHTIEFTTWLEKGYTPKFAFPQGLDLVKAEAFKVMNKRPGALFKNIKSKKYQDPKEFKWLKGRNILSKRGGGRLSSAYAAFMEEYAKDHPTLRLYEIDIEGPFYEEWPHRPKTVLLDNKTYEECIPQEEIAELAAKAFRRPVANDELQPILDFVKATYKKTGSKREALANGIRAILCSPQFYYHYENTGDLNDYALANRLSYFLWSTMPDDRLWSLAKTGLIRDKKVLKSELERMLKDPKSKQLTFNLAEQWLELWKLGSMAPDSKDEPQYYRRQLNHLSKFETTEFLDYILKKNKPVMDILNADYTFMNRGLAEFYEVNEFHKYPKEDFVKTPVTDERRYGIFGHMGILTATANGVDTSQIIRGLWVYENILGKPAPPPPEGVPAIEPDLRNAKTIRDKLEKHREDKACSVCHKKFDHFGFALENFDALGRWRTQYVQSVSKRKKVKVPISSYGKMVSGDQFEDIKDMRKLLLEDEEMFCKTVTSKLLTMAMGREVNAFDREQIESIMKTAKAQGNGFKDILTATVTSDLFKSK